MFIFSGLAVFAACLGPEGQKDEGEAYGADEHERAEEAQVAHGFGLDEDEAGEGGDGGDVAGDQGLYHLAQCLAAVGVVFQVLEVVQRVVDGDAHEHRAYADDDDGNLCLEDGYRRQCEEPSGGYGEAHPQYVALAPHGAPQDEGYEHHGEGYGQ